MTEFTHLLNGMKEAIIAEDGDFEFSDEQKAQIKTWADGLNAETATMEEVLGGLGQIVDGWSLPIGVCIAAIINWLRS
jgi:hypothetical protein